MGDPLESFRVSSLKQNCEGVVGTQIRQYRATAESSSECGGVLIDGPNNATTSKYPYASLFQSELELPCSNSTSTPFTAANFELRGSNSCQLPTYRISYAKLCLMA
ncbi:hypothetical protein DVH24_003485 [Malus domestica]|uniref:Uncharacterized protein n=1 Tax=Malus domestica TaxID=3750 RepID=A0A498ILN3_MALDO|nr:hypothetical protein DVH24_003485 [Malus domestica]